MPPLSQLGMDQTGKSGRVLVITVWLFLGFLSAPTVGRAGFLNDLMGELGRSALPGSSESRPTPSHNVSIQGTFGRKHILQSIPMNGAPGLRRQSDNWSCGPHVAARIAKRQGKNLDYEDLMRARIAMGVPTIRRMTRFNANAHLFFNSAEQFVGNDALVKFFRTSGEEEKQLLEKYFERVFLKEHADLNDIKKLISKNIPVAVLIKNGSREEPLLNKIMGKRVKLNNYHWVMVYGYDDDQRVIHFADSYVDGPNRIAYAPFIKRWNTKEKGFFLDVGRQLFIKERTLVWVER